MDWYNMFFDRTHGLWDSRSWFKWVIFHLQFYTLWVQQNQIWKVEAGRRLVICQTGQAPVSSGSSTGHSLSAGSGSSFFSSSSSLLELSGWSGSNSSSWSMECENSCWTMTGETTAQSQKNSKIITNPPHHLGCSVHTLSRVYLKYFSRMGSSGFP